MTAIDEATQLLKLISEKSKVTVLAGTFVSASAAGCVVDAGGGRIPAQFGTSYLPEISERVWLWFIDGVAFMMGSAMAKPGQGTVVSVAAGLVTLSTDFGQILVPYNGALTPTAGQVLKLTWQGGGYAGSIMSTSPAAAIAPPPPPVAGGGSTGHTDTFTAINAGSFRDRWWTSQLYASDNNLGAWFYGSKIADTLPAAAVISSIQVFVSAQQITGSAPNFGVHPHQSASTAISIAPGWVGLPLIFGNALRAGGGSFGIGLDHGGYSILKSLTQDGQSGALRIVSTY
jgi:hypothetical protein